MIYISVWFVYLIHIPVFQRLHKNLLDNKVYGGWEDGSVAQSSCCASTRTLAPMEKLGMAVWDYNPNLMCAKTHESLLLNEAGQNKEL